MIKDFFKFKKDDTSTPRSLISEMINNLNDISGVVVNYLETTNINNIKKFKVIFCVSISRSSIISFLEELNNINSHIQDDDLILDFYLTNEIDEDGDGSGRKITINNYESIPFNENDKLLTDTRLSAGSGVGLYLIGKRLSFKSNYIF